MMRKQITWMAILTLLLLIATACSANNSESGNSNANKASDSSGESSNTTSSKSGAEETSATSKEQASHTFTLLMPEHQNWPYDKNWIVWDWIEEYTGARFDVQIPSGELQDTINLNVASDSMPDITLFTNRSEANKFGQQGVLVNILDYLDIMPNLTAWMERYPEERKAALAADGGMYMLPNEGFGQTNRIIWMYREDIFNKHNLTPPTTYDELIEVSGQLKALYPDSYPLAFRQTLGFLRFASAQFDTYHTFFEEGGEVRYGPVEDQFKTMITYFNKMYTEGVIPPDWLTLSQQQWQNLVTNDQAFIIQDYIGRLDLFNVSMEETNPDFKLAFMAPPAGIPGSDKNPYLHYIGHGKAISAKSGKIEDILKTFDWYFTEEAREILSWGKDDYVYTTDASGQRMLKPEYADNTEIRKKTGLATNAAYKWFDYDAHLVSASDGQKQAYEQAGKHDSLYKVDPQYNEDELNQVSLLQTAVQKHYEEQMTRFILGERDLSEWDQYVEEAGKVGLNELWEMAKVAYSRMQ